MNCCIIGLDQFGYSTAVGLVEANNNVCVIDKNIDVISKIQDKVSYALCIDITDEKSFEAIEVDSFDSFVLSIPQDFEKLIFIAGLLKKKFNVPMIVCHVKSRQQKSILKMIGIEHILIPEKEAACHLVDSISLGYEYFHRIADNYSITYIHCKKSWIKKSIEDIIERYEDINILGLKVESEIELIEKSYILQGNEIVLIGGKNKDLLEI